MGKVEAALARRLFGKPLGKIEEPIMGTKPVVHTEEVTLDLLLGGFSCARFGDGELRCALGGSAAAQVSDHALAHDLKVILRGPTKSLVCLPHSNYGPKMANWSRYEIPKFTAMYHQPQYGSAFISRPDSAPNINTPEYWEKVRQLWKGRECTLVVGTDATSLNEKMLRDARSVRVVYGPRRDAYTDIPALLDQIGTPPDTDPIILCLGPAATVLAERLASKGCWALDLGHMGKLMPKEYR